MKTTNKYLWSLFAYEKVVNCGFGYSWGATGTSRTEEYGAQGGRGGGGGRCTSKPQSDAVLLERGEGAQGRREMQIESLSQRTMGRGDK